MIEHWQMSQCSYILISPALGGDYDRAHRGTPGLLCQRTKRPHGTSSARHLVDDADAPMGELGGLVRCEVERARRICCDAPRLCRAGVVDHVWRPPLPRRDVGDGQSQAEVVADYEPHSVAAEQDIDVAEEGAGLLSECVK